MTDIVYFTDRENPDKHAIEHKEPISIAISQFDISASLHTTEYLLTQARLSDSEQRILITSGEFVPNSITMDEVSGSMGIYYTPVYAERINYEVWKNSINKTFQELEAGQ
jgi:hypothetical protein